jgi:hypothetical protein
MPSELLQLPLILLDWSDWVDWTSILHSPKILPRSAGVYEVRRLGEKELLHIGMASNLHDRVRSGLVRGAFPHSTGERIRKAENCSSLQVRWAATDRPAASEEELKRRYASENDGRLPLYCKR